MTRRAVSVLLFGMLGGACDGSEATAPDVGPGGNDGGSLDAPLPAGTCAHPVTGQAVPGGTTYESFTLAVATSQGECDEARVASTCDADTQMFLPPPASSATCMVEESPPVGAYFFADCQAGAHASCVAGNNANDGRSASTPKRDLAGLDVDALPAGTHLVFARGGAWNGFHVQIENPQATPTSPIVFGSYAPAWGGTARPLLRGTGIGAFEFGRYNSTLNDGGYTVRNLELDGQGSDTWGVWLRDEVRYVLVENVDIHDFAIGIHSASTGTNRVNHLTVRSSTIRDNREHGWLGDGNDLIVENNTFTGNNPSGGGFEHGMYAGGAGQRAVIRNNTFANNSAPGGVCDGGNLTMHGQWDGVLIEGNVITQTRSLGGCYGISLNPGYGSAEYLRNFIVRGNTVVNVGYCSVCASSAPGIVVENNVLVHTFADFHAAILIPGGEPEEGDDVDSGAIVRNNTIYLEQATGGAGVAMRSAAGTGLQSVSNLVYLGPGVSDNVACYEHGATSAFTAFDYNLCARADSSGNYSAQFATLALAQAAGIDVHGSTANPQLAAPPSNTNGWSCAVQAGSPAIDAGHPTLSSATGRDATPRAVPDIGACER